MADKAAFDLVPDVYDQLVNWSRRLEREGAFFKPLFEAHGVRRVLDLGCGTGRHAQMFASWGLDVVGVDGSAAMVAYCRRTHGETAHLCWQQADMQDLAELEGRFDAVVCLGNALASLPDQAAVDTVIGGFPARLTPGGVIVLHLLNFARLPEGPILWQKARCVAVDGERRGIVKGVHRCGDRGYVDFAEFPLDSADDVSRCRSTPLLSVAGADVRAAFAAAGVERVTLYGGHDLAPFDPQISNDLLAVGRALPGT